MRIGRTLPPAAAPIPLGNIFRALFACFCKSDQATARFEEELKDFFGCKYCFLVSSGKASLTLILQALHQLHPERNEVLIPAFTCYSVPAAIKKAGLKIRLCDISLETLDFQKEMLQKIALQNVEEKRLLCAVPTHLFGYPVDVVATSKILGPDVVIVEDAAQGMGSEWRGIRLGTLGDVGFFSLGRGKALSTIEGGIILTDQDDIAEKIFSLKASLSEYSNVDKVKLVLKAFFTTIFHNPWLFWLPKGLPFLKLGETFYEKNFPEKKFSPVHSTLSVNWQSRLKRHQKARKKNVGFWIEKLPQKRKGTLFNWPADTPLLRFPVLLRSNKKRDWHIRQNEMSLGLGLMASYPAPVSEIPELEHEFAGVLCPNAKRISDTLLTIPVHEFVRAGDNEKILKILCDEEKSV